MDVSHEPRELVEGGGALRLNATYYLTKVVIPALSRLFCLVGADLWVRHRFQSIIYELDHLMMTEKSLNGGTCRIATMCSLLTRCARRHAVASLLLM